MLRKAVILLILLVAAFPVYARLKPVRGAILANRSHPTARGLVGYWLMNEGGGNKIFDLSGNGNTGTFAGDTSWVPGKYGSCLSFDGTGDYVDVGNKDSLRITGDITLAAWVKWSVGATAGIISKGGNGETASYSLSRTGTPTIYFLQSENGAAWNTLIQSAALSTGVWYFVVGTNDLNIARLYIDGVQVGTDSSPASSPWDNTVNVTIGAEIKPSDSSIGRYWSGQIDNVMIYNRALSADEIQHLYREPFAMVGDFGLWWLYYKPISGGGALPEITNSYKQRR